MFPIKWFPDAWNEYVDLQANDKNAIKKANALLKDIQRNGFNTTTGKPEMLKHEFAGYASVRIDKKNRIVFTIQDETVIVIQCGGHYNDK